MYSQNHNNDHVRLAQPCEVLLSHMNCQHKGVVKKKKITLTLLLLWGYLEAIGVITFKTPSVSYSMCHISAINLLKHALLIGLQ